MRCGVGGKIYVLHTSEAIEQEQMTEIRKKTQCKKKEEVDSGDIEKTRKCM